MGIIARGNAPQEIAFGDGNFLTDTLGLGSTGDGSTGDSSGASDGSSTGSDFFSTITNGIGDIWGKVTDTAATVFPVWAQYTIDKDRKAAGLPVYYPSQPTYNSNGTNAQNTIRGIQTGAQTGAVQGVLQAILGGGATGINPQTGQPYNQPTTNYTPLIIAGGIGILALFLLMRR